VGRWNSRHSLYWHLDSAHFQDRLSQVSLGAKDNDSDTRTIGAKSYWELPADSATLGLSLERRREQIDSSDRLDDASDYKVQRNSTLATLHYAWFNATDTWSVTPALRWQISDLSGTQARFSQDRETGSASSKAGLQLGVAYRPSAQVTFTANAGSYYREPSFSEMFGSIGLVSGNPDLMPEQGINVDAGVQFKSQRVSVSGTVFGSERDELIVTTFDARGVGRPVNTGAARVVGLELSGETALAANLRLHSNLTWQSPRSLDPAAGFQDRLLPGEAQLAWYTRVNYQRARTSYWYDLDLLQKRYYDRANLLPAADTQQHSIGMDWSDGHWQATVGIHNLGNDNIEDFNGFPKPGRTWSLSVTRTL
jgi:iron complex outermembrane receptor protein